MKTIVAFTTATLFIMPAAHANDVRPKPLMLGLQAENRELQALAPDAASQAVFGPPFRSAGSCVGDHPDAVIGAHGAVIGYTCLTASANGG